MGISEAGSEAKPGANLPRTKVRPPIKRTSSQQGPSLRSCILRGTPPTLSRRQTEIERFGL